MTDRDYHEDRAREELVRAGEARDPAIAQVHRELAALHRRRLLEMVEADSYASAGLASL
jgi:hypothetical protein